MQGFGTTTEPKNYTFSDIRPSKGTYYYRLKQVDFDGSYEYSNIAEVEVTSSIKFALEQNYPNPFNPATKIKYSVPVDGTVKLTVYNTLGQKVAVLINREVKAGDYEVNFDAANLSSGVYLYKIEAGEYSAAKKMILIR